ncbi:glycosyltransferase family 2 protein [Anaerosacchariphilus polymeriproducens]|uniref:glycosyltransferase family 2 protein n=1 Tax=Anaerosacchariphilus polymeriproducens TaxID=1812858 RepID=UPI001390471B|nr:glycosyltransferase family 2 protein [Anaerosacchariphilus polymeriproducens]
MKPLISIIVPINQVERYLEKCLFSIMEQNYRNLEILLIDDGSTDRSVEICDDFAKKDSRFKVFHIENAGVANARNVGLANSTGDYIAFVDSDDYIASDYIQYLYHLLTKYNGQISACGQKNVDLTGKRLTPCTATEEVFEYSRKEALYNLLFNQKLNNSCWGKLFIKELFQDISYPAGHLYEDLATTYQLVAKADRIIYGDSEKYFYIQRPQSILNSKFSRLHMDSVYFSKELVTFMKENYPSFVLPAEYRLFAAAFEIVLKTKKDQADLNDCVAVAWSIIRKNRFKFIFYKSSAFDYRCLAFASIFGITFTRNIWNLWLSIKYRK